MNGTLAALSEVEALLRDHAEPKVDVLLCPPATLISAMKAVSGKISVGGQDCHAEASGAHTGDISAQQLVDAGASSVLLGHSERRADHGETSEAVCAKALAAHFGLPHCFAWFISDGHGAAEALDIYRTRFGGYSKYMHTLPDSFRRLSDGETVRIGAHDWRVIIGRGHSPEHACLTSESLGVLISGDQVLPRISSNVSVFPTEPDADPLGDWIESIARLRRTLSDDLLVLPAHGEPFRGLHARLDRLAHGHERGLQRLRRTLAESPKRTVDVFGALFARSIDSNGELLGMATGEGVAHLNHLLTRGEALRETDADGVYRYRMK